MKLIDKVIYKFLGAGITYSQSGEDSIMDHFFRNKNIHHVSYLDIGTNHPVHCSNTYLFYRNGGKGVCVEPNPSLCNIIRSKRSKDICLNVGIASKAETELDFYIMEPDTLSTFSKADAEELAKENDYTIREIKKIPLKTYNQIIQEYFENMPHLVSIDVEGLNEDIVNSIDFSAGRPNVFCVESVEFSGKEAAKKNENIIKKFTDNDYVVFADTYLNTIFIDRKRWEH